MAVHFFIVECAKSYQQHDIAQQKYNSCHYQSKLRVPESRLREPLIQETKVHIHDSELCEIGDDEIVWCALAPIVHNSALLLIRFKIAISDDE